MGAGVIKFGAVVVMDYCRSQATLSMLLAEALYYAMATAVSEALAAIVKFLSGVGPKITIFSVAPGARIITARQGVAWVCHLERDTLWM